MSAAMSGFISFSAEIVAFFVDILDLYFVFAVFIFFIFPENCSILNGYGNKSQCLNFCRNCIITGVSIGILFGHCQFIKAFYNLLTRVVSADISSFLDED